jgi:hypothetical protein
MRLNWSRTLSGSIAAIYILLAGIGVGPEAAFKVVMFLILPLACIWFSDAMGGYTGSGSVFLGGGMPITQPSPGIFVRIVGWIVLLLPVVILIIGYFSA